MHERRWTCRRCEGPAAVTVSRRSLEQRPFGPERGEAGLKLLAQRCDAQPATASDNQQQPTTTRNSRTTTNQNQRQPTTANKSRLARALARTHAGKRSTSARAQACKHSLGQFLSTESVAKPILFAGFCCKNPAAAQFLQSCSSTPRGRQPPAISQASPASPALLGQEACRLTIPRLQTRNQTQKTSPKTQVVLFIFLFTKTPSGILCLPSSAAEGGRVWAGVRLTCTCAGVRFFRVRLPFGRQA